ncbi:hypothetical protein [uncultured Brevundimonas sp.]|uniref:hypothetical protein n=1 Tax=uncultured Brevundimonas sp. TaxID=213418 RepID=UPI0025978E96|nr:hypothetical protein [uncultured Brevundimonas sp.]
MNRISFAILALALTSCSQANDEIPGHAGLIKQVEHQKVGRSQDQWIEMVNGIGEWERTGLIFGYADDYTECLKAIEGLKLANPDRQYRCDQAN